MFVALLLAVELCFVAAYWALAVAFARWIEIRCLLVGLGFSCLPEDSLALDPIAFDSLADSLALDLLVSGVLTELTCRCCHCSAGSNEQSSLVVERAYAGCPNSG